jgi:hypothetical protein
MGFIGLLYIVPDNGYFFKIGHNLDFPEFRPSMGFPQKL